MLFLSGSLPLLRKTGNNLSCITLWGRILLVETHVNVVRWWPWLETWGFTLSAVTGPQPPLAFMFSSPWDAMLIRAETAGQSLRIHGDRGLQRRGQEQKKGLKKKRVAVSWEGKVQTLALWKRMPPAVHSWVTLLWTHDPKTSLKGGWVGQWSGRNRARAEANQTSHKRPHISDSVEQEEGAELTKRYTRGRDATQQAVS